MNLRRFSGTHRNVVGTILAESDAMLKELKPDDLALQQLRICDSIRARGLKRPSSADYSGKRNRQKQMEYLQVALKSIERTQCFLENSPQAAQVNMPDAEPDFIVLCQQIREELQRIALPDGRKLSRLTLFPITAPTEPRQYPTEPLDLVRQ